VVSCPHGRMLAFHGTEWLVVVMALIRITNMKPVNMKPVTLLSLFTLLCGASLAVRAAAEVVADPELSPAEQAFADSLTGAKLVGRYTTWDNLDEPQRDTYSIEKVAKLNDEMWMFVARIQYAGHDARLPLPLPVKWAGKTPVITLDKLPIPGFGTFSARIVIQEDQYAGTWDGGDHGGHMYGRIVKEVPKKSQQ
ncbi:MAG: hypothetical protein MK179_20495, partial [Pirellulaceae bacterium]|nr:hypothetical protein [Pirellulaceae bacterium]